MSTDFQKIKTIAKESLMPDFFAVRIEEEELWKSLQELLSKIQTSSPIAYVEKIKQIAKESSVPIELIEKIKKDNLWEKLRGLITTIKIK